MQKTVQEVPTYHLPLQQNTIHIITGFQQQKIDIGTILFAQIQTLIDFFLMVSSLRKSGFQGQSPQWRAILSLGDIRIHIDSLVVNSGRR